MIPICKNAITKKMNVRNFSKNIHLLLIVIGAETNSIPVSRSSLENAAKHERKINVIFVK